MVRRFKNSATRLVQTLFVCAMGLALFATPANAATPAEGVQAVNTHVVNALQALDSGNVAASQAEFKQFTDGWPSIEAGVRNQDRPMYRAIEARTTDVQAAFATQPPQVAQIRSALQAQIAADDQFAQAYGNAQPAASTAAAPATAGPASLAQEVGHLDAAQQRIKASDAPGAAAEVRGFIQGWPDVEGAVSAKAPDVYSSTENNMAKAYGLLTSNPPRMTEAALVIGQMQTGLRPFAEAPVQYNIFDAAIILLREGFEALLVLGALLAFLKRSGNGSKQRWIWAGGTLGLAVSAVIAVVVNVAFAAAGGSSRELIEGITGLVAAAMLLWMIFWLHSKASIGAWSRYISRNAGRALATNSLISLALIAFLAVLREGAETVLFYVGIAPAISSSDLVAGLGIGAALLAVTAVLMLVIGVRIPIRPFFLATSALIFFLAFKFTGFGVHSLQVAGILQSHTAPIPPVDVIGLFPSWESTGLQLALLVGVAIGLRLTSAHDHEVVNEGAAAQQRLVTDRA